MKLNILHVTSTYNIPSQTFVRNTISLLSKKFNNSLLTTYILGDFEEKFKNIRIIRNYSLNEFRDDSCLLRKFYIFFHLVIKKIIRFCSLEVILNKKFIIDNDFDLLFFHFGWTAFEHSKLIQVINRPVLISFHGSDLTSFLHENKKYRNWLVKISHMKNVFFTVNSKYLMRVAIETGLKPEKIHILYNTFSSDFNIATEEVIKEREIFQVTNISRSIPLKGQKYLLEGFSLFCNDKDCRLNIIGDGPELENLKKYAKDLGIIDKVIFHGTLSPFEVKEILYQSSVYVQSTIQDPFTKQTEAFGVVLLEAMSASLPIIATNVGGIPEVLHEPSFRNLSYFLVKEKDGLEIKNSLEKVYFNYDKVIFKRYSKSRLSYFSNENFLTKLEEIIGMIL